MSFSGDNIDNFLNKILLEINLISYVAAIVSICFIGDKNTQYLVNEQIIYIWFLTTLNFRFSIHYSLL